MVARIFKLKVSLEVNFLLGKSYLTMVTIKQGIISFPSF